MERPAASQAIRAASVWTVEHAGTKTLKMYHTASIKKFSREYGHGRANYINGPLVAGASSLPAKAISPNRSTDRGGRAPFFLSVKRQAASDEQQAASDEQQATSVKQAERQAASVECGPNHQAPSMAFRDDRSADLGSRSFDKV